MNTFRLLLLLTSIHYSVNAFSESKITPAHGSVALRCGATADLGSVAYSMTLISDKNIASDKKRSLAFNLQLYRCMKFSSSKSGFAYLKVSPHEIHQLESFQFDADSDSCGGSVRGRIRPGEQGNVQITFSSIDSSLKHIEILSAFFYNFGKAAEGMTAYASNIYSVNVLP